MHIVFGSDHAGFHLKNTLLAYVRDELGYEVIDCGAYEHDPDDDYTDFIGPAAQRVSQDPEHMRAVILGGSGQGEAMLANRFQNARAAVYYGGTHEIVELSRLHNDANVLSLGARFLKEDDAKAVVKLFLSTEHPQDERYDARIEKAEGMTR